MIKGIGWPSGWLGDEERQIADCSACLVRCAVLCFLSQGGLSDSEIYSRLSCSQCFRACRNDVHCEGVCDGC